MAGRMMDLTPELVARVHRIEPDEGPPEGMVLLNDDDYRDIAGNLVERLADEPLRVFAYGSLIWKPEFSHASQARARLPDWHRSFCLKLDRWRGTRALPGLMLALDDGGHCDGIVYTLPDDDKQRQVERLLRREMSYKPTNNQPMIVTVDNAGAYLPSITFTVRRDSRYRVPGLPLPEVARILARAAGHFGSGAEYLHNTVAHLEQFGIEDDNLWQLQKLVAAEIRAMTG